MSRFERRFPVDKLAEWDQKHRGNAVRSLFDRWSLPGETASPEKGLRLGIRKGYLNFYVKGQSIAKLTCGPSGPTLYIHNAYASHKRRGEAGGPVLGHQTYDSHALANAIPATLIDTWIGTAETYTSAEKRFVDDLIAANAGAIDLEMALPANAAYGDDPVAPRMDLVVAQRSEEAPLSIGFWEAKCANNPELRASGKQPPRVIQQIEKYTIWLARDDRRTEVQSAYQHTATILLELYSTFRGQDSNPSCIAHWQALTKQETLMLAAQAGIVIGNYWPPAKNDFGETGNMARYADTFVNNGHRGKLERENISLYEVGPNHSPHELPLLPVTSR